MAYIKYCGSYCAYNIFRCVYGKKRRPGYKHSVCGTFELIYIGPGAFAGFPAGYDTGF